MIRPVVVITVEGGVVTNVATNLSEMAYRIIDIDSIKCGEQSFGTDSVADETGIDIEKYSEEIIKDAKN